MTTSKIQYSLLNFCLCAVCCILAALLWGIQANHRSQQRKSEQEIQQLHRLLEEKRQDELKLKLFTLKQLSNVLNDPGGVQKFGAMAKEMVLDLAPHYRHDPYLWWVLLKTNVLADGISLDDAKKILGEPQKFTTEPAFGKPPYYEWHGGEEKITADLVEGKFQFWRTGRIGSIGGY
ncbi:MAG: hypothetical protein JNL67_17655 [Planctomycetaceae bacterium]|nr:hypothetical protein [Planctomycetaceae bacterium]